MGIYISKPGRAGVIYLHENQKLCFMIRLEHICSKYTHLNLCQKNGDIMTGGLGFYEDIIPAPGGDIYLIVSDVIWCWLIFDLSSYSIQHGYGSFSFFEFLGVHYHSSGI